MSSPSARLTKSFLSRAAATGMTDAALAAALGVTRQFYSDVKLGKQQPTTRFMVGAVHAGLAETFGDVAEPIEDLAA